jgi:hypothetical protein
VSPAALRASAITEPLIYVIVCLLAEAARADPDRTVSASNLTCEQLVGAAWRSSMLGGPAWDPGCRPPDRAGRRTIGGPSPATEDTRPSPTSVPAGSTHRRHYIFLIDDAVTFVRIDRSHAMETSYRTRRPIPGCGARGPWWAVIRLGVAPATVLLLAACSATLPVARSTPTTLPRPSPTSTPAGSTASPTPTPAKSATTSATLTASDLSTIESVYISDRNHGYGRTLYSTAALTLDPDRPPRAAIVPGSGEWAFVSYVPASGDTVIQSADLQDGVGEAFYFRPTGGGWLLRGIVGEPAACGASRAGVPTTVLNVLGWTSGDQCSN